MTELKAMSATQADTTPKNVTWKRSGSVVATSTPAARPAISVRYLVPCQGQPRLGVCVGLPGILVGWAALQNLSDLKRHLAAVGTRSRWPWQGLLRSSGRAAADSETNQYRQGAADSMIR